jgi:uncharacterized protein DUF4434
VRVLTWRSWAAGLSAALVCAAGLGAEPASPRLHGTFLQLWSTHGAWTEETWQRLFGYLERLRVAELVVQWSVYEDLAFYPSARHTPVPQPPLSTIMRLAAQHRMTVLVGLASDPAFWTKVAREPDLVESYLRASRARSESVARELVPLVASHPSFRGWYISEEIEDGTWRGPRSRTIVTDHLRLLAMALRGLTPGARIAISGFSNAQTQPSTFGDFWTRLLQAAPIDVFLFQDGIGARKQRLSFLPLYLEAAREATRASGRELRVIVELFEQIGETGTFMAAPAPLDRIEHQLTLAAAYSEPPGPIGFSLPEYATPLGGPAAERLYDSYIARVLRATRD